MHQSLPYPGSKTGPIKIQRRHLLLFIGSCVFFVMYQIIGGGVLYSDLQSVEKTNSDLLGFIKKLGEGKRKLETKLDIQSYESANNFETIIKNHGKLQIQIMILIVH